MRWLFLVLTLSLWAVPAQAVPRTWQGRVSAAERIARQHFQTTPPCGHVTTVWKRLGRGPPNVFGGSYLAQATPDSCLISLNADAYEDPYTEVEAFEWPGFCTIIAHEYGHLLGLQHSDDPRDLMYPRPRVLPECRVKPRRAAR